MDAITITKQDCEKYQFESVPDLVNPLVLQLTEVIWGYFKNNKSGKPLELVFDFPEFNHIQQTKFCYPQNGSYSSGNHKLLFGGKSELAHELTHMFYNKNNSNTKISYFGEFINGSCELLTITPPKNYNYCTNHCKQPHEKIFSYLYLADDEELKSKFTGYYVTFLNKNSVSENKDAILYEEMKNYKLDKSAKKSILDVLNKRLEEFKKDKENKETVKKYFDRYIEEIIKEINSKSIADLVEKINKAGQRFTTEFQKLSK
ncbi:MAG: hypothetical protein PHC34_11360 [Candidatus Gastranaerophilales bacterium]|nr:hypothetical protein [Candidatus Gastranaerophilales bacterium]